MIQKTAWQEKNGLLLKCTSELKIRLRIFPRKRSDVPGKNLSDKTQQQS